jgi:ABC-2 type transport system permease protein
MVRFFRQRNRVIGALGQPIIFWLLFGFGLRESFRPGEAMGFEGMSYLEFFFPGVILMILLFTAIFSTISIIEDRKEGFLQSVLAAPVPRASIVLGKLLGGTSVATLQGMVFLALAPTAGISLNAMSFLYCTLLMFVIGFSLTALGVCMAWKMESTQGFHALMNLFLMPMWLLSGAFFPAEGVPAVFAVVMKGNPMTYSLWGIRHVLYPGGVPDTAPGLGMCIGITVGFAAFMFVLSMKLVGAKSNG